MTGSVSAAARVCGRTCTKGKILHVQQHDLTASIHYQHCIAGINFTSCVSVPIAVWAFFTRIQMPVGQLVLKTHFR